MRRSLTVLGGLVAAAVLVAGCGGSDTSEPAAGRPATGTIDLPACPVDAVDGATTPVEVTLWYQLSGKAAQTLESQVTAFNASQSKVKVTAELQGVSYDELLRKYEQGIPSRDLPDMLVAEDTATKFLIDSDTVFPAQSCFDASGVDTAQFNPAGVNHYTSGGALWPGTVSLSNILTYYNKNHFRRGGLDPETPPQTLADVRRYAEQLKAAGVVDKPVVLKVDSWFLESQLTGAGQEMVDNDNGFGPGVTTEATFDTPLTQELVTWVKQMVDDGLMTPVQATDGNVDHYLAMAAQRASITIETSTAATSVVAFLGGDTSVAAELGRGGQGADIAALDIGAGPVFGVNEAGKAQVGGNGFYMMNTSTPEQISASWRFLSWWNELEQQVTWNLQGSYLPFLDAAAEDPRVRSFWTNDLAGKWLGIAYTQLEDTDPDFTGALIGPYDKFRQATRDALAAVSLQATAPDAAIRTAVDQTNAALAAYNDSL